MRFCVILGLKIEIRANWCVCDPTPIHLTYIFEINLEISDVQTSETNRKHLKNIRQLFIALFFSSFLFAQDQNLKTSKIKVDGVSAVIGDYVILESDIDKTLVEMKSQGIPTKGISRCQLLGKLMEDKLYAHHAIQDSLEFSIEEIYSTVDQIIDNFTQQLGSIEKVLDFYNKDDESTFRQEIFEINKTQKLSSLMQAKIVENIEVTPEEVRIFFESIPTIDLPIFGTELEISQIVIEPEVSEKEENRIINRLKTFKEDVIERGSSFASKALLYSQDPGSRSSGGKYTLHRKRPRMVKEFRDEAFSLEEGEISDPFKTDFGWHILKVDKIRGQEVDIRHILLTPKIESSQLQDAKKKLDTLRKRLIDEEISFSNAALAFSDEKEIWIQELNPNSFQLIGQRFFVWRGACGGVWTEGPHIYKKDGKYYLIIAEGGTSFNHSIMVAVSDTIIGPYVSNERNPIFSSRHLSYDNWVNSTGHGDLVELEDGRWYIVMLGVRGDVKRKSNMGRETFIAPVSWEREPYEWKERKIVWPVIAPQSGKILKNNPIIFSETIENKGTFFVDEFNDTNLDLAWNHRRAPMQNMFC